MENVKIFSGRTHQELAKQIAEKLHMKLGDIIINNFPDGEIQVQINESIRGKNIFIIQPTSHPVNESIMELLIIIDACRRASAKEISVLIPYFGYSRQSKKSTGREPISAKLVTNLLVKAGADRLISVDLHKPQIQAYMDKPFDHLSACGIFLNYLKKKKFNNPVIVAPDLGKAKLAEKFSSFLNYPMIIMYKKKLIKDKNKDVRFGGIIGDVKDKTPIIVDDIIANGTAVNQALALLDYGCKDEIYFTATHPVLLADAMKRLTHPAIREVIVTNSIPVEHKKKNLPKLQILSLADMLAEVIYRIQHNLSVSEVFHKQRIDFPV